MDKHVIKRDGLPPIAFTGDLIGSTTRGRNDSRWTEVKIYRTQAGRFVAQISRLTCWQGENDHRAAASFATAAKLIEWLKEGSETLGAKSQEAVEDAAKTEPAFATAWVEEVE